MENLENRYKQSEDELRQANQELRRQLQEAQKSAREATHQWQSLRQSVIVTETEEFASLKRIEGQMRLVVKEFKSAELRLSSVADRSQPDQRTEKLLSTLNQQIQALDDELEADFNTIVAQNGSLHRQELASQINDKQLQILLKDAQRENLGLREQLEKMQSQEQERTQTVWLSKLELVSNEKRALQAELKKLVDISAMREQMLTQENRELANTVELLRRAAADREQFLQQEMTTLREQVSSLMQQIKQKDNQMGQSILLGTPSAQQVVKDIVLSNQSAQALLHQGQETELALLRNLNENLTLQLKEANQILGRPAQSFEVQNGVGIIYNKLETRLTELTLAIKGCLHSLEISATKVRGPDRQAENGIQSMQPERTECLESQHVQERLLFEAREEINRLQQELDSAKVYLVQHLSSAQAQTVASNFKSAADEDMVGILVAKFSKEIERLKTENAQLKKVKENITQFYKDEFARLWTQFEELPRESRTQHTRTTSQNSQAQEAMAELRELLQDLQDWISSLKTHQVQALKDKVELLKEKQSAKAFRPTSRLQAVGVQQMTSRETYQSEARQITHQESNFSFNFTPVQQKLLFEEIEILRGQVSDVLQCYRVVTLNRDNQLQILLKETELLRQREAVLDSALAEAIEAVQTADQKALIKAQLDYKQQKDEMTQLKEVNLGLIQRLKAEKEANEKELEQVQSSYQLKFVQVKEHETLLELQLAQLEKELKVALDGVWQVRDQKDQLAQSLLAQIASLKKFANQRQAELLETRRQVTLFYKKAKDSMAAREQELKKFFKDHLGGHMTVLEIECQKLQRYSQKYQK